MGTEGLPQGYPFRFVDTVSEPADAAFSGGEVRVRVSANGRGAMGEMWRSPLLLAEAIAQAALLLEGGDPESPKPSRASTGSKHRALRGPGRP